MYLMSSHYISCEFKDELEDEGKPQKQVVELPVTIFNVRKIAPSLFSVDCHLDVTSHETQALKYMF